MIIKKLSQHFLENRSQHLTSACIIMNDETSSPEFIATRTDHINLLLHDNARKLVKEFRDNRRRYLNFTLDRFASKMDPKLLKVRAKRCLLNEDDSSTSKIRKQSYALSKLLFITDSTCSMPFHVVITEFVLCHGGSHELVGLLNRSGIILCASIQRAKRLATFEVHERMARGIIPELVPNTLSIVSY